MLIVGQVKGLARRSVADGQSEEHKMSTSQYVQFISKAMTRDSPCLLVGGIRPSIETEQGSQELDGIVVPSRDGPLLVGLGGRKGVVRVTATEDNVGSYTRGPVDLKTVVLLLDSLNGDGVDALSGESSDGGEESD